MLQIGSSASCKSEPTLHVSFGLCGEKLCLMEWERVSCLLKNFAETLIDCKYFIINFLAFTFWENKYWIVSFIGRYSNLSFNLLCESYTL